MAQKPSLKPHKSSPMPRPKHHRSPAMQLYDSQFRRLYINAHERRCFLKAAQKQTPLIRAFCLVLAYSGCRISEALALTAKSLQVDAGVIAFRTLKRRDKHVVREVPVPKNVLREVSNTLVPIQESDQTDQPIWQIDGVSVPRQAAYRWIKAVMRDAGIKGKMASPKGLRHGFGIHAMLSGVQLNMLQKWMGHASIETTAIYANAIGKDERDIARRMWDEEKPAEDTAG